MSTAQKQAIAPVVSTREVILAKADDWTALYIDGKKVLENHNLSDEEILKAVGITVTEVWVDDQWLERTGYNFPPNASELPY